MSSANTTPVDQNVFRLREVLHENEQGLQQWGGRLLRGPHGASGELYQWFLEVGGYKYAGEEEITNEFNTYELHPVISAGEEGLVFSLHLEHHVCEEGNVDQEAFDLRSPDLIEKFKAVAVDWNIDLLIIDNGVAILNELVKVFVPILEALSIKDSPVNAA